MVNNRFMQGSEDDAITLTNLSLLKNKVGKTYQPELNPMDVHKLNNSVFKLYRENRNGLDTSVFTDFRSYNLDNNLGKTMVAINLGLFSFSIFGLVQAQETPSWINYGALGLMVVAMMGYIYYLAKSHREERKEWREAMGVQHKEATEALEKNTTVLRELHSLIATINAKV